MTQFGVMPDSHSRVALKIYAQAMHRNSLMREEEEARRSVEERRARIEARRRVCVERTVAKLRRIKFQASWQNANPGQAIMTEVAERHGLLLRDFLCESRRREILYPKQEAMYLIARDTPMSFPRIGKLFQRDHTTIMHGVRSYADRNGLPRVRERQAT